MSETLQNHSFLEGIYEATKWRILCTIPFKASQDWCHNHGSNLAHYAIAHSQRYIFAFARGSFVSLCLCIMISGLAALAIPFPKPGEYRGDPAHLCTAFWNLFLLNRKKVSYISISLYETFFRFDENF